MPRPTIVSAIVTFAFGLSHGRMAEKRARRRVLRVNGTGISIGAEPIRSALLVAQARLSEGPRSDGR